jgi:N6-L-threonylcarbamoyladenine synthase
VAILEKHDAKAITDGFVPEHRATLHFHQKITADSSRFRGIHPLVAAQSHQSNLANLVATALKSLPLSSGADGTASTAHIWSSVQQFARKKPDLISVTRGPGMRSSLATGIDMAKGLAVAFEVPLVAVNHMQAHALTPRLVSALEGESGGKIVPEFPFMSLLVSGGHTLLVYTKSLNDHKILASTVDIAVGDFLDKVARKVVPRDDLEADGDIMYGRLLEKFAFSDGVNIQNYVAPAPQESGVSRLKDRWGWTFAPPLLQEGTKASAKFSFSGLGSAVERCFLDSARDVSLRERVDIGQDAMRVAFEHLASRVVMALEKLSTGIDLPNPVSTLVVSGGVASNKFLKAM